MASLVYERENFHDDSDDDDDDDDGVTQHGGHTPNNRLTKTSSLGLPCSSDIGQP